MGMKRRFLGLIGLVFMCAALSAQEVKVEQQETKVEQQETKVEQQEIKVRHIKCVIRFSNACI